MTSANEKWTFGGGHAVQWMVLAAIFAACAASRFIKHLVAGDIFFWDYWVYQGALAALGTGADPYAAGTMQRFGVEAGYNFTYPPIALDLLDPLAAFDPTSLLWVYSIVFAASALWLLWLLATTLCASFSPFQRACALVAGIAAFTMAGTIAVSSANLGVILNAIVLTGLVYAIRSRSYLPFFLAVLLCSSIKPFYLQFLIVPIVVNRELWAYILKSGTVVAASAAIYLLYYLFSEARFASWMASIADQSITQGVPGNNVFGFALRLGASSVEALAIHGLFCVAMLLMAIRLKSTDQGVRLSVALIVASFLNPRIMMYDAQIAAIPVFYLILSMPVIQSRMRAANGALLALGLLFVLGLMSLRGYDLAPRSLTHPLTGMAAVAIAYFGLARSDRLRKAGSHAPTSQERALQAVPATHPIGP